MEDRVDIALAVYQGADHLAEQLESILKQSHSNWHLVAGDDGSTDSSPEILQRFAAEHPDRTTLLPTTSRLGTKANFSRILSACRSDYVLTADQDDIWLPEKIEWSLQKMQELEKQHGKNSPLLVHTDAIVTDQDGHTRAESLWAYQHICPDYGLHFKNLLVQNVITGCTLLANRPLLDLALPVAPEAVMHDWWLALAASAMGRIGYIRQPTLLYRQHQTNRLGARKWSAHTVWNEARSGRAALKKRIDRTRQQAATFQSRLNDRLPPEPRLLLDAYIRTDALPPLKKQLTALKYRFQKCGILRTVGFYLAM